MEFLKGLGIYKCEYEQPIAATDSTVQPISFIRSGRELQAENERLKEENEELKKAHDRRRGVPAEELVAQMTGGKRTGRYKELYDITTENGTRIEVKLSKVDKTKRWVWDNILGRKEYDYLVLAGEKDKRWLEQYPKLEYVFFLVPRNAVTDVNSKGDCIALNANFATARAPGARVLIEQYLVHSQERFKNL